MIIFVLKDCAFAYKDKVIVTALAVPEPSSPRTDEEIPEFSTCLVVPNNLVRSLNSSLCLAAFWAYKYSINDL